MTGIDSIEALQPYLSLINTVISLAVLGIIFNLIKTHRETITERINALKDRLDGSKEDSERKDKWFTREKEQLEREKKEKEKELSKLQTQLDEILKKEGVTFQNLALGQTLQQSSNEVKTLIEELTNKMLDRIKSIVPESPNYDPIVSQSQLTLAKAQMAKGNYDEAAENFEHFTTSEEASWEVYFSKAVNLANFRYGDSSNYASVKAYNDAINVLPIDIDSNTRARVFGYRGAVLKRLGRLDESEADLKIAAKYATGEYEKEDINYNLACVYSLQGEKDKMLTCINNVRSRKHLKAIKAHISDYFKKFENDSEFNLLLAKISG